MIGPGRIASTRRYSGRIVNLDVDQVRFPDGSVGELEMVRHPGASVVLPFLGDPTGEDPQVLLIHQYRYAADGFLYELPAGRLEADEAPEACARRELREETGCTAERIDHVCTFFTTPGFTDERIHAFMASGLVRGAAHSEADEFVEVVPMSITRALQMIRDGEIVDAKTALTLLYVAEFRLGA